MRKIVSSLVLIVPVIAFAEVEVPTTLSSFNKEIGQDAFAVVYVNPFPADATPPPVADLQKAFKAVSAMDEYDEVSFIQVNLAKIPGLSEKLGVSFDLEHPPAQPDPSSFPATVLLYKDGIALRSNGQLAQLKGYFIDRDGSAESLITFIDKHFGTFLQAQEKTEASEEEETEQVTTQPTTSTTTYVTYETPQYTGGYYPGGFYPLWWSLWWAPYYRYRSPYFYGWRRPYGRGYIGRPIGRRAGVIRGRPLGRRAGVGRVTRAPGFRRAGVVGGRRISPGYSRGFGGRGMGRGGFGGMRRGGGFRGGMGRGGMRGGMGRGGGRRR